MGGEEPVTQELRIVQADREAAERRQAEQAPLEDEAHVHDRRADRAAYLREKLEERAASERDAG